MGFAGFRSDLKGAWEGWTKCHWENGSLIACEDRRESRT